MIKRHLIGIIALMGLSACATATTIPEPELVAIEPQATLTESPTATATQTAAPPTATATATVSATPSVTPTPTHPLMIEVMRQQDYPGSDLVIEEVLPPNADYDRFIMSYQSEGLTIYAYMTVPRVGEKPADGWPVIIFNHGYIPPDEYRSTERYVAYVDGFARQGYIVFRSDYRGHGFSEGRAEGGYGSPAYTVDVLNGLASVRRYPDADSTRIGMWGHSMGGYITMRAMVIDENIRSGVIWGGVVGSYDDIFTYWWNLRDGDGPTRTPVPNGRGWWRNTLYETFGYPQDNPEFWDSISATSYLDDISGPIQLHHGTNDQTVPYGLSRVTYERLIANGVPSQLWLYEGDDHNISQSFTTAMIRSVQFFNETVKP